MKEGWEYKTLGEVANVIHGKNQKEVLSEKGKYPIYGSGGTIMGYATEFLCPAGTTILGRKGTINNPLYIEEDFWNVDTAFGISPKENVSSKFVYYYCRKKDWGKLNTGTTLPSLTQSIVKSQIIPIPSFTKQEEIVSYLDTTFANIEKLKSNASKALSEAKALFQAALAEAMMPKEGWEEKTLKEIGSTYTGTTPSKSHKENYGDFMPFIRPSEINKVGDGKIHYDSEIKLSQEGCNNGRVFSKNSILMVCIGATIGKVGFTDKEVSCNQQINVLTPNVDYDYKFIYYSMNSAEFQKKVFTVGTSAQTTLPIINKTKWENLTLKFPIKSQQHQIVRHLDTLSSKVRQMEENYRKTLAECDALKQAILRDVFE